MRARIGWKHTLALDLDDPGFDYSVLSEFRERLLAGQKEQELPNVLLRELTQRGLLKTRCQQRADSTRVLAAVRQLNQLELVGETMRRALNELVTTAPKCLCAIVPEEWFPRCAQRFDNLRLPRERSERERLLETIAADGLQLLSAVSAADSPTRHQIRQLARVEMLRRIWVQQFWTENLPDFTSWMRVM